MRGRVEHDDHETKHDREIGETDRPELACSDRLAEGKASFDGSVLSASGLRIAVREKPLLGGVPAHELSHSCEHECGKNSKEDVGGPPAKVQDEKNLLQRG